MANSPESDDGRPTAQESATAYVSNALFQLEVMRRTLADIGTGMSAVYAETGLPDVANGCIKQVEAFEQLIKFHRHNKECGNA